MPNSTPTLTGLGASIVPWLSPNHDPPADMPRLFDQEGPT
jgi:hypothetical protein